MIWVFFLIGGALLVLAVFLLIGKRQVERQLPEPAREPLPKQEAGILTHYGKDEIVALVKDPHWLHAYWEITSAKQQEVSEIFGPSSWEESRPVIRVYDVTGLEEFDGTNAPFSDVEIDEMATSWYLNLGQPNHSFYLDLGRLLPGGRFIRLARSNRISLPSNAPSQVIDPLWPPLESLWAGQTLAWGKSTGTSPAVWGVSSVQIAEEKR